MTLAFNDLSHQEAERLALLLEEMGEAQQAVGKILRHGYGSCHPSTGVENRDALESELGDVMAAVDLMVVAGDISGPGIRAARKDKAERMGRYLHHQPTPPQEFR